MAILPRTVWAKPRGAQRPDALPEQSKVNCHGALNKIFHECCPLVCCNCHIRFVWSCFNMNEPVCAKSFESLGS